MPAWNPRCLFGPVAVAGSAYTEYVAPTGGALIERVTVSNPTASTVTLTLSVGTDAAGTRLFDAYPIPANDQRQLRLNAVLEGGDVVQAFASEAYALVLSVDGWTSEEGVAIGLTLSGNEITDTVRSGQLAGDGRDRESSMGIWEATTNLITNGGFETDTTGWTIQFSATITRDTSTSKFGSACGKITCTGVQFGLARFSMGTLVDATTYTYSIWVNRTETTDDWRIDFAAGGGLTGQTIIPLTLGWQRITLTGTSTSTVGTYCRVVNYSAGAASVIYVDGAQFEQQPLATPYVETDGGTASRSEARVQAPASLLDETQGWVAFRARAGWVSTSGPAGGSAPLYFFTWGDDGDSRIAVYYTPSSAWGVIRQEVTADLRGFTDAFAAGDVVTVIAAWTASAVRISVDGAAFVSNPSTAIPTLAVSTFDIGTGGTLAGARQSDFDFFWFACGTGTLDDADAAAIHANGNTDPQPDLFDAGAALTMIWSAINATARTY